MCLIIHGPSALVRSTLLDTPHLLDEVFKTNADGLGVMYNTTGGIRARKWLPKSLRQVKRLVACFPNDERELAVHWRMRTHGDIDEANTHPYAVDDGFVMHNGILEIGNSRDKTKSNTWHYCRQFLEGGLMQKVAHDEAFLRLVSDHIGHGNKIVMLTADGRMSIAGRHRGIDMKGLWFSNTYAWDPITLDPSWVDPAERNRGYSWPWTTGHNSHNSSAYGFERQSFASLAHGGWDVDEQDELDEEPLDEREMAVHWQHILSEIDPEAICELLDSDECFSWLRVLFDQPWSTTPYKGTEPTDPDLMRLVQERRAWSLAGECEDGRRWLVAETLAWYVEWDFDRPPPAPTTVFPRAPSAISATRN